jgi:DNA repair photolyase
MSSAYRPIQAKVLLSHVRQPDTWFGLKYNMNLYRGCQHRCIYCDSRSECYRIDHFDREVLVKVNAIDLLRKELASKRVKGTIGLGSMNDPYMPLEEEIHLTRRVLHVIAEFRFPVHIITKSDRVLRELEVLRTIARTYAAVSFTITTADDELGRKVEPGAPLVSARLRAMEQLAANGILTGVTMMPVLPFIGDTEENVTAIVERAHASGASYVLPWFGMSLRDRQRAHYYRELDRLFPGLREQYERRYSDQYRCDVPQAGRLARLFEALCGQLGLSTHIPSYGMPQAKQLSLF